MIVVTHTPGGLRLTRGVVTACVTTPPQLAAAIRDLTARPAQASAAELGKRIAVARLARLAMEAR